MNCLHPLPRRFHTTATLAGITLGLAAGPIVASSPPVGHEKLRVVCTTTMITDLAMQIAGEAADIVGIMRPAEDPHIYRVRPRDVQLVAGADLLLMNGLHLESTLEHVIDNNAQRATVVRLAHSPLIKPLESEQFRGAPDPHCWFNIAYFSTYAVRARDALIEADPKNAEHYQTRADAYIKTLGELDHWVRHEISTIPREQRVMVTSHDAFQYFGKAYAIDVYAVIGISTEQQPRPGDFIRLENLIRDRQVKAVFIETSVSQTLNSLVKKIAVRTGVTVGGTLYSDSLGDETSTASTYVGMIRSNVATIVNALK